MIQTGQNTYGRLDTSGALLRVRLDHKTAIPCASTRFYLQQPVINQDDASESTPTPSSASVLAPRILQRILSACSFFSVPTVSAKQKSTSPHNIRKYWKPGPLPAYALHADRPYRAFLMLNCRTEQSCPWRSGSVLRGPKDGARRSLPCGVGRSSRPCHGRH